METKNKFDDYQRVENAAKDFIRAIVWESMDVAGGDDEKDVETFLSDCQSSMGTKLIEGTLTECKQRYDWMQGARNGIDMVEILRNAIVNGIVCEIENSGRAGYDMGGMLITNRVSVGGCLPLMHLNAVRIDKKGGLLAEVDIEGEIAPTTFCEREIKENLMTDCLQDIYNEVVNKINYRLKKMDELRLIVKQNGGEINFDGDFRFRGNDFDDCMHDCEDVKLFGLSINGEGEVIIDNMWQGDAYDNGLNFIADCEIDRFIDYVKNQTAKKFTIRMNASREFEVMATDREKAIELAKAELEKEPLYEGDIDGWSVV